MRRFIGSCDEAGRLYQRAEAESTTTWYYHATGTGNIGKVSTITAPGGYAEYYWYEATHGLPLKTGRAIDGTTYYFDMEYDGYGRLDTLEYPTSTSGYRFKLDYDYDSYGHLQYVKDYSDSYAYYTLSSTDSLGRERSVYLGNGRTETRDYDEGAGYLKSITTDGSVQDLDFTYDEVGNVLSRADSLISETESFSYDNVNRLTASQVTGESSITLNYSAAGRITSKSDVGSYTYGAGGAGPFAVTSANGASYGYDGNGRMTSRAGSTITWYSFDKPKKIDSGSNYTEFWYGPDRARYKQVRYDGATSTIRYVSSLFEFEDPGSGNDIYRHHVQAGDRVVALVTREDTGSPSNERQFLHRDNQGSVTKITNSSGTVDQALAFDPWGLRRDATDWSALGSPFAGSHETERGYTGHEHLDAVGLVHMNGRVQDPVLGRFISADPLIQAPYSTQSHNRYAYVWNNPTSLTDPSGFCTAAADFADCDWGEGQSILHAAYAAFTDWLGAQSENGTWDTRAYFFHHNGFRNTEGWYWANYADEHQAHRASRGDNSVPNGTRAASAQPAERNESGATTYPYPEQSARAFTPMTSWGASVPELASMRGTTATQDQIDHAFLFNRGFIQPDSGEAVSLVPDILAMVLPVGRALRTGSTIFRTGHYASRLEAAGVNVARAEAAVASEVSAIRSSMATNADVVGRMRVDGVLIEYRMRLLPDEAVNVGTIFPVR